MATGHFLGVGVHMKSHMAAVEGPGDHPHDSLQLQTRGGQIYDLIAHSELYSTRFLSLGLLLVVH
jgi:hypothetical protein